MAESQALFRQLKQQHQIQQIQQIHQNKHQIQQQLQQSQKSHGKHVYHKRQNKINTSIEKNSKRLKTLAHENGITSKQTRTLLNELTYSSSDESDAVNKESSIQNCIKSTHSNSKQPDASTSALQNVSIAEKKKSVEKLIPEGVVETDEKRHRSKMSVESRSCNMGKNDMNPPQLNMNHSKYDVSQEDVDDVLIKASRKVEEIALREEFENIEAEIARDEAKRCKDERLMEIKVHLLEKYEREAEQHDLRSVLQRLQDQHARMLLQQQNNQELLQQHERYADEPDSYETNSVSLIDDPGQVSTLNDLLDLR